MASTPAVDLADLGAWLVKARGSEPSTLHHVRTGFVDVGTWCVRPSYRAALVRPGHRVLLWVSGSQRDAPAGIHAHGEVLGPVTGPREDLVMPVRLRPLSSPVLRDELLGHPVLGRLEVVRMPAGSNPSYVTRAQLAALGELCPELAATASADRWLY